MIPIEIIALGIGLFLGLIIGAYGTFYIVEKEGLFDAKSNSRHQR